MTSTHRYILVQIVAKVAAALSLILMIRFAGAAPSGGFLSAQVFASLTAILVDAGGSKVTLREASCGADVQNSGNWRVAICRVQIASAAAAIISIFGILTGHWLVGGLVVGIGAVLTLNSLHEAQLLGAGRGGYAALGNLISNLLTLCCIGLALALGSRSSVSMLVAYFIGTAGAAVWYRHADHTRVRQDATVVANSEDQSSPSSEDTRSDSLLNGALMLMTFIYYRGDLLLMTLLMSQRDVGIFGASYRMIEVALGVVQLVAQARQPQVAREVASFQHSRGGSPDLGKDTFLVLGAISSVFALACIAVGPQAFTLMFGAELSPGPGLVAILALAIPGQGVHIASYLYLFGVRKQGAERWVVFAVSAMSLATMTTAVVVGARLGALEGVATAEVVAESVLGLVVAFLVLRHLGGTLRKETIVAVLLSIVALPVIASLTTTSRSILSALLIGLLVCLRARPFHKAVERW